MDNAQHDVLTTAKREMVVSHLIAAPAALVFKAWTEPKQLEQWWAADGFTTTVHQMDVQEDGITHLAMQGPDGLDYPNHFVYSQVKAARLLSYLQSDGSDGDNDAAEVSVAVSFDEKTDGRTRVTLQTLFKSADERDRVIQEFDALNGARQTLERLSAFMAQSQSGS